MTDKWKNERRPARRPGGDAARTSKGVTKFSGPRPSAGGRDAETTSDGRRFGDGKPAGGKFGAPKFGKPKFGSSKFGSPKFGARKFDDGKFSEGRTGGDKPAHARPRPSRFADERAGEGGSSRSAGGRGEGGKSFGNKTFGDRPSRGGAPAGKFSGGRPSGSRAFGDRPPASRFGKTPHPESRRDTEDAAASVRPDAPERIAKAMSRAGVASRRDAEVMIAEGRVAVNGKVIDTPVTLVTANDRVEIDGAPMPRRDRTRLWLYHKPRGLVTTSRDPEGRSTVFDALPEELPRVVAIGRLDINTEGLLLLTNDGGLSRVLAHPDTGWLRRYRVRAYGDVDQAQLDSLRDGITIDDMHYGPVEALIQRRQGDNIWLTLGLREGKNREVKRILEHLGLRVNRLIRVSFGPFQLGDLPEGEIDEVRTRILKDQLGETLAAEAGADFDSGAFEPNAMRVTAERSPTPERPAAGREGRYRSKEDFLARAPRSQTAPALAPAKREAHEQRSRQRAVWRDDETEGGRPRGTRIPRRGADARAARELSATRVHERAGAVTDPGGRKVKVERIVAPPRLAERSTRPQRDRDDDAGRNRSAGGDRRERFGQRDERGFEQRGDRPAGRSFGKRDFGDRAGSDRGGRPERAEGGSRFSERGERSAGRSFGKRDFGDRAGSDRGGRPERGEGGSRFSERGERPAGRSFGKRDFGDRAGSDRGGRPERAEGGSRFSERGDRPAGRSFGKRDFGDRAGSDRGGRPERAEGGGRFSERGERPAGRSFGKRDFGDRAGSDRGGRPERAEGGGRFSERGERSAGRSFGERRDEKRSFDKRDGDRPSGKSFGSRSEGGRGRSEGGKSFGDKSFSGRPAGGKSFSGKSFSGKPSSDRPSGGRPPRGGSRPPRKF